MLTVIAIDDEPHAIEHLKNCCINSPFVSSIRTFTDPFNALPILASEKIDILFLDFHMGKISAPDFIKYLPNPVKVVIVSSEMKYKIQAYNMDIEAIINKPYNCKTLLETCKIVANKMKT